MKASKTPNVSSKVPVATHANRFAISTTETNAVNRLFILVLVKKIKQLLVVIKPAIPPQVQFVINELTADKGGTLSGRFALQYCLNLLSHLGSRFCLRCTVTPADLSSDLFFFSIAFASALALFCRSTARL